ncbi:hypothetical protein [Flavobacterium silvaticum]|uniref:Uncharacterized protein n=1 Tax=Flavobacterium silvaticum TaxID=1852020 RepID=A0A972FX91_9FLAO|nr:hypothetical protein [Flavobacterium silvaticum]NMH26526.1 hypothetical protein [Flavobacterium silvaticum]
METKKATIRRDAANAFLVLDVSNAPLEIILTDDNPNNVKSVFNVLLKELKGGAIEFELEDDKEDLYRHICTEYISQLNGEMKAIYQELDDYDLLEEEDDE